MQVRSSSQAAPGSRRLSVVSVVIAIIANLFVLAPSAAYADTYITGVTASATSSQSTGPNAVLTDIGLTETSPGSGVFQLTTNQYTPPDGAGWNSGSLPGNTSFPDQNPYIQFDLGASYTVDRFHVWNYNGDSGYNFRGFKDVTIQYSADGVTWKTVAQRFRFAQGPGLPTYTGEDYSFTYPIQGRYIRFQADSTYRNFGPAILETAGLGKVRFHAGGTATTPPATGGIFPSDAGVVNVKFPPYNAKGDGVTDDTAALRQAITDWQGTHQTIYLPAGTYKVSGSLALAHVGAGFTNIRGESAGKTAIRLADGTFANPASPQPILDAGNNGGGGGISADWFNNNFGNLTIDTGSSNPGAIGVQFYSNNVGAIRNMVIKSGDGQGVVGLDLGYADQNGPMLARNITVTGFDTSIRMAASVNSQTLENITINNPNVVGIRNDGQCVAIRNLTFTGGVTAILNNGFLTITRPTLKGNANSVGLPAIINNEGMLARSVNATSYARAIQNNFGGTASPTGLLVSEFSSHPILSQFPTRLKSLSLTVKDTPDAPLDSPANWANVRNYRLITDGDDTLAVQRAIDSGKPTIYFPAQGTYYLTSKVFVRGAARRIVGMFASVFSLGTGAGFQIEAGTPTTVWVEDTGNIGGSVDLVNNSARTLVCRNLQDLVLYPQGTGDWILENVAAGALTINGQNVWARQLNIERANPKVTNNGGTLWITGMKAEDGGTLIKTTGGGKTELLGGLYYSQVGDIAPMFINQDSTLAASVGEVNFSYNPFQILVTETRNGVTRNLTKSQTPQRLYVPGSMLPLYVGYYDPTYLAPPYNIQGVGGDRQITLTWDAMPGATSYKITRATSLTGSYTTLATVTTNSYVNTGLTSGATYYYKLTATYPTGTSAASAPVSATANVVYRINSGGSAAAPFAADAFFTGGNAYGVSNAIDVSGVASPAPQAVYQTMRWGQYSYNIPALTPGASYKVRLHFAEIYFSNPGQRVFSVAVNGVSALTNFDIIAAAGGPNKAVLREFTTTADANGKITIDLTATVDNGQLNGVEVVIP